MGVNSGVDVEAALPEGGVVESSGSDSELALVLAALAEKQRDNPLEFLELMPSQLASVESKASTVLVFGGNRCLGGECEIFDPVAGKLRRIDEIDEHAVENLF